MYRIAIAAMLAAAGIAHGNTAAAESPPGFVGVVAEDVFAGADDYRDHALARQRDAGVEVVRQTFSWETMEPTPGHYELGYHDEYVADAASYGIRVVPVMFRPPRFIARRQHTPRKTYPPRSPAAMARFGATLARRYGSGGSLWRERPELRKVPITSYQIWNEPNLPIYWPKRPNARAYAKLLKAASRGIKRVDPRAEIITAGLPESKYPGAMPLRRYINSLYRAGAKRSFDTLAINTYARNARELIELLRMVRATMNRRGDRKARIWASEFGWANSGPKSRFLAGSKGQARRIRQSIAAMGASRRKLGLRGFVYWNWKDAPPYRAGFDFWGLHAGLLRRDETRKPAYGAFVNAVKKLK